MTKTLLVLGAGRYYVKSIKTARSMGLRVIVTDRDPFAPGVRFADAFEPVDISNIEESVRVAERHRIDGVIPLNDFGVPAAAAICEALGLPGLSPETALRTTTKSLMRSAWEEAGVPSAQFRVANSLDAAMHAVKGFPRFPLILKPNDSRGGGSRGVSIASSPADIPPAFSFAQSFYDNPEVIIEEFLIGTEHSVETMTFDNTTHVLAVSDKVKTPVPYRVDKSVVYPTTLDVNKLNVLKRVCINAVRALGIKQGPAHVELCYTSSGPKLFEIGARCGGGGTPDPIIPYITGIEMLKETVRIALGNAPNSLVPKLKRASVYRFLTPEPGLLKSVHGLDNARKCAGVLDCDITVAPGDEIRPLRTGADRAGFIISGAGTRKDAIAVADKAEQLIEFEYVL